MSKKANATHNPTFAECRWTGFSASYRSLLLGQDWKDETESLIVDVVHKVVIWTLFWFCYGFYLERGIFSLGIISQECEVNSFCYSFRHKTGASALLILKFNGCNSNNDGDKTNNMNGLHHFSFMSPSICTLGYCGGQSEWQILPQGRNASREYF